MADKLVAKIDGYGHWSFGYVNKEAIEWISGWYTYIPNVDTDGYNKFDIEYLDGYKLYDQYASPLDGGADALDVPSTETYVCPQNLGFGPLSWADVNPAGAGVGANYTVDGIFPAHICRARKENFEPFTYSSLDGYFHEMFLLFAYSAGLNLHTFFWAYVDWTTSLWAQVLDGDPALPAPGELFNIWVPSSVNISQVKWSSGLVQDVDKLLGASSGGGGGGGITTLESIKSETTLNNVNFLDGTTAFTTIDVTNLVGTNNVILGFCNGIEANVFVGDRTVAAAGDDIIVDTTSAGYPAITDVYWNGAAFGTPSTLGDLILNDIIRLYYVTAV